VISAQTFLATLVGKGFNFFAGVPDSSLKSLLALLEAQGVKNYICANEGAAIAVAAGYHLATNLVPIVYMQNSGLGNAINPLLSLTHQRVYAVPILLIIGWRGEPGKADEPQHFATGEHTTEILQSLDIPCKIISIDSDVEETIAEAVSTLKESSSPFALLCRKGLFDKSVAASIANTYEMSREEAIKILLKSLPEATAIVCTTGQAGRELYEFRESTLRESTPRESTQQNHRQDFLNVGAMGHASQIALGIALEKPDTNVVCIDGDGALIMHMGALAIIGQYGRRNFRHVVINNGVHDSVGGQPTAGLNIDIPAIATACGYKQTASCHCAADLPDAVHALISADGPSLLEIRVHPGGRDNLSRPPQQFRDSKSEFMSFIKGR